MKASRRNCIKKGALFLSAIFVPRLIRAFPANCNPAFFRAKPAASGGGGGATTATDNFSRADINPISSPGSDGVMTWTSGDGGFDPVQITSGKARGVSGNWCSARVASPSFSADHTCSITIQSTSDLAPAVRMQTNGDCYSLIATNSTTLTLYYWDGGGNSPHSIATFTVSALSAGDVVTLVIAGTTLTAKVNGSTQGSTTDSTYAAGQPGFLCQNTSNISLFFATT